MTSHELREWRESNNLSQAALAALLNLPQQRISEWERGPKNGGHKVPRWMAHELSLLDKTVKKGK